MTFSDANPIQFWDANCDTFNEKQVDGIFARCFCQIFNLDDKITVQFTDSSGNSFTLFVVDSAGTVAYSTSITGTNNTFTHSFTPSAQSFAEGEYQFIISSNGGGGDVINSTFNTDLDGWGNEGSGTSWIWDVVNNNSAIVDNITNGSSKYLSKTVSGDAGLYHLVIDSILFSFTSQTANVLVEAYNGATKVATLYDEDHTFSVATNLDISTIATLPAFTSIKIKYSTDGNSSYLMTSFQLSAPALAAKSDCISLKTDHDESILINYHNNRVFASLNTNIGTPDPEFNLRIPAIFFEENHPEEGEFLDLTDNSMTQLNATVKFKKKLEVKPMPQYMHLKTKLVLKFHSVEIEGDEWLSVDGYEMGPLPKRHPLRKATCWLTKSDYLVRNVL